MLDGLLEQKARELLVEAEEAGREYVRSGLKSRSSLANQTLFLLETLLRGSDDEWSGRKNDIRRAWFDGVRGEAQEEVYWRNRESGIFSFLQTARERQEEEALRSENAR